MPELDATVLIIDNDRKIFDILLECTNKDDLCLSYASCLEEGLHKNQRECFQVILMRDSLPDGDACYALQDFQCESNSPEIVILSSRGDSGQAEIALKSGAWDYVIDIEPKKSLPHLIRRALRYRHGKQDTARLLASDIGAQVEHHGIIGRGKLTRKAINFAAKIAQTDANVLISGETGTGKELFATIIHNLSSRASKNLTIVDCAALPSTLVESILFGHVRGSFTGADKAQPGIIKQSDGGTLFLDEVAEMPPDIQKKFLRVIQERKYLPVGGTVETNSNFRLIAATNKDLYAMVEQGDFRQDLLFRLKTFHLELPPLRLRTADITELVYYYRDEYCKRHKVKKKKLSPDYVMFLTQYSWPGNVRELFQAIECSIANAGESAILYAKHLPLRIRIEITKNKIKEMEMATVAPRPGRENPTQPELEDMPTLKGAREKAIADQEEKYLHRLLTLTEGSIQKCCAISGLSRSRLYDLLKKYHLSRT